MLSVELSRKEKLNRRKKRRSDNLSGGGLEKRLKDHGHPEVTLLSIDGFFEQPDGSSTMKTTRVAFLQTLELLFRVCSLLFIQDSWWQ